MKKANKIKLILVFVVAIIMLSSFIFAYSVNEERLSALILIFGTVFFPFTIFVVQLYFIRFKDF